MICPKVEPSNNDISRHYDELDQFYRQVWGEHLHHGLWSNGMESIEEAVEALIDYMAVRADIRGGQTICDVGAGYGATSRYLVEHYGVEATALTMSEVQHAYACILDPESDNPEYVHGDWFDNDYPADRFDIVLAVESMAHMADKAGFFKEAHRVLRPGGRLVVCAWLAAEQPKMVHQQYLLEPICRDGRLPGLAAATEYQLWIKEAGLLLDSYEDLSQRVQKTWAICLRRVTGRLCSDRRYVRFLVDHTKKNRRFVLAPLRMWLAYRAGALQYGLFIVRKPGEA